MEPLSTIALLASLALPATAKLNWGAEKIIKNENVVTSIINTKYYRDISAKESTVVDLITPIIEKIPTVNATNDVSLQLENYSKLEEGWDGSGSVKPPDIDIKLAIDFVDSIPAIFPLPKAMLSRDGEIGLYWDDSLMYIDIQFESDHTLSVFSRDRSSGKERYIDSVDVSTITSSWYFDTLDLLLSPSGYAQAA